MISLELGLYLRLYTYIYGIQYTVYTMYIYLLSIVYNIIILSGNDMNYAEKTQCVRPWMWLFSQTTTKDKKKKVSRK